MDDSLRLRRIYIYSGQLRLPHLLVETKLNKYREGFKLQLILVSVTSIVLNVSLQSKHGTLATTGNKRLQKQYFDDSNQVKKIQSS
jgi:hypothetical protein